MGCALNPIRWRGWRVSLGCMVCSWSPTLCADCPHFLLTYLQKVGTGSWLSFRVTSMLGRKSARQQCTRGIRMQGALLPLRLLPPPSLLPLPSPFHLLCSHSVQSLILQTFQLSAQMCGQAAFFKSFFYFFNYSSHPILLY